MHIAMKKLHINGEVREFEESATLQMIIQILGVSNKVMAIAVNTEIVKSHEWNLFIPKDSDHIELLHFVGGG